MQLAENRQWSGQNWLFRRQLVSVAYLISLEPHSDLLQTPSSERFLKPLSGLGATDMKQFPCINDAPVLEELCNLPEPNGVFLFCGAGCAWKAPYLRFCAAGRIFSDTFLSASFQCITPCKRSSRHAYRHTPVSRSSTAVYAGEIQCFVVVNGVYILIT